MDAGTGDCGDITIIDGLYRVHSQPDMKILLALDGCRYFSEFRLELAARRFIER